MKLQILLHWSNFILQGYSHVNWCNNKGKHSPLIAIQPGNLLSSTDAAYNGDDSLNEINSSLTGTVGTALYVAPEVVVSAQYNQVFRILLFWDY